MTVKLPQPIETYFRAANAHNSALLADCFTEDALVHDEGKDHHGLAAIREWNETTNKQYDTVLEPIAMAEQDGEIIVTTRISGNFEGSPIELDFYFALVDQKIIGLRIS